MTVNCFHRTDLVDAVDLSRLYSDPARLGTGLEVRVVPSRRTRVVVACANKHLRLHVSRAHVRRGDFLVVVSHAVHDQLLHAAETRGAAVRVALLLPGVGRGRRTATTTNLVKKNVTCNKPKTGADIKKHVTSKIQKEEL